MRVIRHLAGLPTRLSRVVLALGNFDGVHRGHASILAEARRMASTGGRQVVVLTFQPHPVEVLVPDRIPWRIQSLHDRLARLRDLGVDAVVAKRFTHAFAALEAEAFVEEFLLRGLDLVGVVTGPTVSFGRGRRGSLDLLRELGRRHGYEVRSIDPVLDEAGAVSSTALRTALAEGDMETAGQLLGYPYRLRGRVVPGDRRGRTIGFPTANLHVPGGVTLPPDGVYAARAKLGSTSHGAVLNIGVRPTFGRLARTIEAHLLEFDADVYGQWMAVEPVRRLRGERRFDGVDALREGIANDVQRARAVLCDGPAG